MSTDQGPGAPPPVQQTAPPADQQGAPPTKGIDWDLLRDFSIVLLPVAVLLGLAFPVLRDLPLSALFSQESRTWLYAHKPTLVAWAEWLRILFEVLLALIIGNQIFNARIRSYCEGQAKKWAVKVVADIEKSLQTDDTLRRLKTALTDLILFVAAPGGIRDLPGDLYHITKAMSALSDDVKARIPHYLYKLTMLKLLRRIAGGGYGLLAYRLFLLVLLMKVVKFYLDSSEIYLII
jgi:hypothetical protein